RGGRKARCKAAGRIRYSSLAPPAAAHYPIAPKWAATSTIRFEKPHSLSYHDNTLTNRLSSTWVWVTSKVELCGSWLKSTDTVGALLMPTMPRSRLDLAASSISEFT